MWYHSLTKYSYFECVSIQRKPQNKYFPFTSPCMLPLWLSGKEAACQHRRHRFHPGVGKIPWGWKWKPTPVFLPGKSHREKSLVGYSPWSHKELDTTEPLSTHAHKIRYFNPISTASWKLETNVLISNFALWFGYYVQTILA